MLNTNDDNSVNRKLNIKKCELVQLVNLNDSLLFRKTWIVY